MRRECLERFPRHRRLAIPICITRRMRNPQFYVYGKRPIDGIAKAYFNVSDNETCVNFHYRYHMWAPNQTWQLHNAYYQGPISLTWVYFTVISVYFTVVTSPCWDVSYFMLLKGSQQLAKPV